MTQRPTLTVTLLSLLICVGQAQSLDSYIKLRKKLGISQAVGVQALETMLGSRTLEIKGVVKGAMRTSAGASILLEKTDGDSIFVRCTEAPDWLSGNEVPVRMIVRAERVDEASELTASMLAVAPEGPIATIEDNERREAERRAAKLRPTFTPSRAVKEWNLPSSAALPVYANFIQKQNKRLSEKEALRIATGIVGFSLKYGVDARLIMAMVMCESGFNPNAVSRTGAMGLGQLMPGTARGMGVGNAFDSIDNLYGTVRLVRGHLDKYKRQTGDDFDSLVLALAAYNAGGGAVAKHGGVPPFRETQNYVRKVISTYYQFCGRRR